MSQKKIIKELKEWPKFKGRYKKEMSVEEFIDLKKYPKETVLLKDLFPIANEAFPTKFNLSVAEYIGMKICKKRGNTLEHLFDYTQLPPHSFWTITINSREPDIELIKNGSNKHLILFHIAGVGGFSITSPEINTREFYIKNFIKFLEKYVDLSKLKITFFNGGLINNHGIKKDFPLDWNKKIFSSLKNKGKFKLVPTKKDTFLSLKVFGSPIHWGYRNEFNLKYRDSYLDIGTIEFLPYIPKFEKKDKKLIYKEILPTKNSFIGSGVGLERLQMLKENVANIWEISNIKPLISLIKKISKRKSNNRQYFIVEELFRFFHFIYSERGGITSGKLGNKHRREIVSKYLNILIAGIIYLEIPPKKIKKFFKLNSRLQFIEKNILERHLEKNFEKFLKILLEQLRIYNTSTKYKPKIDNFIKEYYN